MLNDDLSIYCLPSCYTILQKCDLKNVNNNKYLINYNGIEKLETEWKSMKLNFVS